MILSNQKWFLHILWILFKSSKFYRHIHVFILFSSQDSKAPSEVDTQNVFEVQPEDPSDPIEEEAVNESKQNGLDPSDDSLFFENKQHNGYQPPYINHSSAQQFQEMEVDIGTIDHEDITFKPKVSVEQCLAEITVIIR